MRAGRLIWTMGVVLSAGSIFAGSQAKDIPKHGRAVVLFDGKDLHEFDVYLKSTGLNQDPTHVFKVEDKMVHVSGTEMGYFVTKQDYRNYYLRAEVQVGRGDVCAAEWAGEG